MPIFFNIIFMFYAADFFLEEQKVSVMSDRPSFGPAFVSGQ